jgi:hypothetical protein
MKTKTTTKRVPRSKTAPPKARRLKLHHVGALALAVLGAVWGGFVLLNQPVGTSSATDCSVSGTLVNACRPWLGAAANNYPQASSDTKSQILYHEQRIGRQLDLVHTYHPVGDNKLDDTDLYFATRADTYLFANWKPAAKWADANGGNASVNAGIDKMANSIKTIAPKKIFLTLHHEPENDVTSGGSCSSYKGAAGTTDGYKAMWQNVENRFKAAGTTNVVWVMDYMNYAPWDCVVNQLYPGDNLVDWITFNGYGRNDDTWKGNVGRFYNFLTTNSNAQHNYLSKAWGIAEWSIGHGTSDQHATYFDQVRQSLTDNTFPNLKMYMAYDSRDQGSDTGSNVRVAYDDNGNWSENQMAHYKALANDPHLVGSGAQPAPSLGPRPTQDKTPPTISVNWPHDGATISKAIYITGTATDNVGVTAVTLRIDNRYVATDNVSPYAFKFDYSQYRGGKHTIVLRAWDDANNMAEAKIGITVDSSRTANSASVTNPDTTNAPRQATASTTVVSSATPVSPQKPVTANGLLIAQPVTNGNAVRLLVDGKAQSDNIVDTAGLTNGTHRIQIIENGLSSIKLVSVTNPLPLATLNSVRANPALYAAAGGMVIILLFAYASRSYVFGLTSFRERRITARQRGAGRLK